MKKYFLIAFGWVLMCKKILKVMCVGGEFLTTTKNPIIRSCHFLPTILNLKSVLIIRKIGSYMLIKGYWYTNTI